MTFSASYRYLPFAVQIVASGQDDVKLRTKTEVATRVTLAHMNQVF